MIWYPRSLLLQERTGLISTVQSFMSMPIIVKGNECMSVTQDNTSETNI